MLWAQLLGHFYFDRYEVVALLVMVRRQFCHTVVRYLLLSIMLCARSYFHSNVAVESRDHHLITQDCLRDGDIKVRVNVGAISPENWMCLNFYVDDEVALGSTVTCMALLTNTKIDAIIYTFGYVDHLLSL